MSVYSTLFTGPAPKLFGRVGLKPPVLPRVIADQLPRLLSPIGGLPWIRGVLSSFVINRYGYATSLRPRALSMAADYTSFHSLTDRTFTGRHLPPASAESMALLPPEADVVALYRRAEGVNSSDTSVLFMFFAQWFTDSFLITDRNDFRKNMSTQEVDLCQIYGLTPAATSMLRSGEGGRLKSQLIDGAEFPQFLFSPRAGDGPRTFKPEFKGLFDEQFMLTQLLPGASDEVIDAVFAVGLDHGNATIGTTILNTLFLREHNRIAGVLARHNPDWDDDRLFETTRNIMIVLELKIVVEDYIKHIAPFDFPLEAVPLIADRERWYRPPWIAIEFNLLYRWHSLVPEEMSVGGSVLNAAGFVNNNPLVIKRGIDGMITDLSHARAWKIGLFNTPFFLVDSPAPGVQSMEQKTVSLMRNARLRSYNDYRESYGLNRFKSYAELTKDSAVQEKLQSLYGDIDNLEWYVGIFAEDYPDYMMMGQLLMLMVGNDAFTQALSHPLLSRNVFNADTFSPEGMEIIKQTSSLRDIVVRNSPSPQTVVASFDWLPAPSAATTPVPPDVVVLPQPAEEPAAAPEPWVPAQAAEAQNV